ncbi:DEKNAAC100103 [Brettanomyces naardenensis]|uniref:ribonuclease III n=1 Tax=Brettanomyces naardenensis TaxID=13370 RepID=A0A448YEG9_BRENA|nr:DEKNAAC100103 [Brettanomyces naardenensis]
MGKRKHQTEAVGSEPKRKHHHRHGDSTKHRVRKTNKIEGGGSSNTKESRSLPEPVAKAPLTMTTAEALALEYTVSQLQESVRKLINDAPDLDQLSEYVHGLSEGSDSQDSINNDEGDSIASRILILTRNQKVQLAAKLKTLYEQKKLRLFKQIAQFDETTEFTDVEPVRLSLKRAGSEEGVNTGDNNEITMHYINVKGPNGEVLPQLPVIEDRALEARVFMHKSLINNIKHLSPEDVLHSHNERLEFLGDSVLGAAVTQILFKRFPNANEGDLSIMRSKLVNNARLFGYSCLYEFDKRLHKSITNKDQFLQGKQKLVADVFEAYVGGLFVSGNYSNFKEIKSWLAQVMEKDIAYMEGRGVVQERDSLNKNAKAELYAMVGSAALHPQYVVLQEGDGLAVNYKVNCMMNDEVIGQGEAKGMKEAGIKAAMAALSNREAIGKYNSIRMKMPRDRSVIAEGQQTRSEDKGEVEDSVQPVDLPVEVPSVGEEETVDMKWKNELYKYLGERKSLPEYKIQGQGSEIKALLSINSVPVCYCVDKNGKRGSQQCAKYMLENPKLFKQCFVFD